MKRTREGGQIRKSGPACTGNDFFSVARTPKPPSRLYAMRINLFKRRPFDFDARAVYLYTPCRWPISRTYTVSCCFSNL